MRASFSLGVPHVLGWIVVTLLILSTAAIIVGSWRFTLSLAPRTSADTLTAWLVVLTAQICLLVLGVGMAGQLRPVPLAVTTGVAVALQVIWSITGGRVCARRSGHRVWAALRHGLRRSWRHPMVAVLALLVLAQYLWRFTIAVRFPVLDHDGNSYHLISVDNWVQQEAVTHSPQVIWADVFPQNSELITAWSTTFLHHTWLAGLTQFLFVAMGVAAVAGIASNAGATRSRAALAGLLFAATPIVFLQAGTAYVDVAASASVLAAWQLLISAYDVGGRWGEVRRGMARQFLVAGLAVGMMLGTKWTNVVAAGLATVVAVLVLLGIWRRSRPPAPPEPIVLLARAGGERPVTAAAPSSGPAVQSSAHGGTTRLSAAARAHVPLLLRLGPVLRRSRRWTTIPLCAAMAAAFTALAAVLTLRRIWRALRTLASPKRALTAPAGGETSVSSAGPTSEALMRLSAGGGTTVLTAPAPRPPASTDPDTHRFWHWASLPLCALLVPAVLVGGFWYIRNLVTYGNPMWPIIVPFFRGEGSLQELVIGANTPREIADLPPLTQILRSWSADLFPHPFIFDQRLGGFGPQWLLMAPAMAVMILGFLRDRLVYLLGLLLPFAILFLLHPSAWWSRYTIFVAGLGAVCYVLAVQWLAGRWERALHVAVTLLVAVGMWWAVSPTYLAANDAEPLSPSDALELVLADEPTRSSTRYPWKGYADLADLPPGSVIAIPDTNTLHFTHPYAGTELDRRLVVIPTPDDVGALHASLVGIGADYVVLGQDAEPTAALARAALLGGTRFRHVGATFEGLLFAVR